MQHRLLNLIKLLREFFYCEGAGVSGKALDIEGYFVSHYYCIYMCEKEIVCKIELRN